MRRFLALPQLQHKRLRLSPSAFQRQSTFSLGVPLIFRSYLRLRRSQISAAIEPTTPIAANPANASISRTDSTPAYAATVVAISIPSESQILIVSPLALIVYLRRLRSQISAAIDPTTPIAAMPEKASISGTATAA